MPRRDIIYRTLQLISSVTDDRRRLKQLEEETGIPDRQWKHVWALKQRPTAHMLEALSRRWPEYAFWLATGIVDLPNGHIRPGLEPKATDCSKAEELLSKNFEKSREFFEVQLLGQEVRWRGQETDAAAARDDPEIRTLGGLVGAMADDTLSEEDEELWIRYLALLNRQEDAKELDRAIARIAREKRLQKLATKFGINVEDPLARIELVKKEVKASVERNAHSGVKEASQRDSAKRG